MIEQFFKFCVVGGSGVFVDFGITYLCKEWLKLNKYVANSLGFLCASTSNYILNRIWTFPERKSRHHGPVPSVPGHRGCRAGDQQRHHLRPARPFPPEFLPGETLCHRRGDVLEFLYELFLHLLTGLSFRPRIICVCGYGGRGVSAPRRTPLRRFLPTSSTFLRGVRRR